MLPTAIILAIIVALIDGFVGIKEPWRKVIWIGIVILFVLGVVMLLIPGLLPVRIGWY